MHRQCWDEECALDTAGRMRAQVCNILKPCQRSQSQYAAGGNHGESQPSLPADVGLGESDRHQRREHPNRQQVRHDRT